MVRVSILILSLVSLFLLNACGNNLNRPANIDDQEAVAFKTGRISGQATRTVEFKKNDKGDLEPQKEKEFFQEVKIDADFDTKAVSINAKIMNDDSKKMEDVVFEGNFDETGYALLLPKNPKIKIKTKALVRCIKMCDILVVDMGVQNKESDEFEYEQFELEDKVVTRVETKDKEIEESIVREINPTVSELSSGAGAQPIKAAPPKPTIKKNPDVDEESPEEDIVEPGVESGKYQRILNDEIMADKKDVKSSLIPLNLGDKYPGKAIGFYSRGNLFKGIDMLSNVAKVSNRGFESVDRVDGGYYGSGLLVKMIEEVGKMYSKAFPGQKFQVNDLSRKAGGKFGRHASHQNGLDADVFVPRTNGKVDYPKVWEIIKSFHKTQKTDILILNPKIMKEICTYLKSSKEKDYSAAFASLYQDELSKKCKRWKNKKCVGGWTKYYPHTNHIHVRAKCTPHNPSCKPSQPYTKSKFGVCK